MLAVTGSMKGQRAAAPASITVTHFSQGGQNTLATFQNLATQTHTVMGVSGTWIGSDDKMITINEQNAPLSAVLDDICHADPRFSWAQAIDGSIQIHLGKERLGLLDVAVNSLDGRAISPEKIIAAVVMMPEVRLWSSRNKCRVGKVIVGGGIKKTSESPISILGNGQPLWKVLDQIAEKADSYLWSMVKYSNEPCAINLNP